MTRTSAIDYAHDGIYMNSVDTGWITEELPDHDDYENIRLDEPPIDKIDGAARVVDPIFEGVNHQRYIWGHFLKDYQITEW